MATDRKDLVIAFVQFLKTEISSGELGEDAVEGLEVAMQCLESAYDVEGCTPPPNTDLLKIYQNHSAKFKTETSTPNVLSEADKKLAEEKKLEGNNFMKGEKFADAIDCYTKAIQLDGNNAIYYCNRAAAYTKLENNLQAIADCKEALRIDPTYGKAYGRMGLAFIAEKAYANAADSYEKALKLEPNNESYKSNLNIAREQMSKTTGQQPSQPAPNNPLAGLDLNSLLSNPAVMNMAQGMMQNPAMQNLFQNFMGGAGGPPGAPGAAGSPAGPGGNTSAPEENIPAGESPQQEQAAGSMPGMPGGFPFPQGLDFGSIMNATQQVAAQLREQNPDLADSLRQQFQQGQSPQQQPPDSEGKEK